MGCPYRLGVAQSQLLTPKLRSLLGAVGAGVMVVAMALPTSVEVSGRRYDCGTLYSAPDHYHPNVRKYGVVPGKACQRALNSRMAVAMSPAPLVLIDQVGLLLNRRRRERETGHTQRPTTGTDTV